MRFDRMDALVLIVTVASLGTLLGSLFDFWATVYYSLPLLTAAFMLMGALNLSDAWHPANLALIAGFCVVMAGLFIAAHATLDSTSLLGGLPIATAIFFYMIWPFTAIGGPLIYAAVHKSWLIKDLADDQPPVDA